MNPTSAIFLPGLPANHPASALATYGLYALLPDAKISFKSHNGSYAPVLISHLADMNELVRLIRDPATWSNLNLPPTSCDLDQTQYFLSDFAKLYAIDPELAVGIGTDLKIKPPKKKPPKKQKRNEISVARSPFFFVDQSSKTFHKEFTQVLALLPKENIQNTLSTYPWERMQGKNFGYFPESITIDVFKNQLKKKQKEDTIFTVPSICLLAVAAWRLFPSFVSANKVLAPGWRIESGEAVFTYPVFTKPLTRQEAISWFLHPELPEKFAANRNAWHRLGVSAVHQFKSTHYPKGGGYLNLPTSL